MPVLGYKAKPSNLPVDTFFGTKVNTLSGNSTPSTPPTNKAYVWFDSSLKKWRVKYDDGTIESLGVGLSGAVAHKTSHVAGGSDPFVKGDFLNAGARYLEDISDPASDSKRLWLQNGGSEIRYWDDAGTPVKQALATLATPQTFSNKILNDTCDISAAITASGSLDIADASLTLRDYDVRVFRKGSTYYAIKHDGTVVDSGSVFETVLQSAIDESGDIIVGGADASALEEYPLTSTGVEISNQTTGTNLIILKNVSIVVPQGFTGTVFYFHNAAYTNFEMAGFVYEAGTPARNWTAIKMEADDGDSVVYNSMYFKGGSNIYDCNIGLEIKATGNGFCNANMFYNYNAFRPKIGILFNSIFASGENGHMAGNIWIAGSIQCTVGVTQYGIKDCDNGDGVEANEFHGFFNWDYTAGGVSVAPVNFKPNAYFRIYGGDLGYDEDNDESVEPYRTVLINSGKAEDVRSVNMNVPNNIDTYSVFKEGSTYISINQQTGVKNHSTAFETIIQDIIDDIPTRDGGIYTKIRIGPGEFIINDTITIADKYNVAIEGSGQSTTRLHAGPSLGSSQKVWDIHGSVSGTSKALTANTTQYGFTATMSTANAATFSVGDMVLLRSDKKWWSGAAAGIGKQGEFKYIEEVDTGTGVITFTQYNYDTYLTADSASMIKMLPAKNIQFSNLTFGKDAGYTDDGGWVMFQFVDDAQVSHCDLVDATGDSSAGIVFRSCVNSKAGFCNLVQTKDNTPNNQYGIAFNNCSQNCEVVNCTSVGQWRHSFQAASWASGTNMEGICRGVTFTNCTTSGNDSSGFDCHAYGDSVIFSNCSCIGAFNLGAIALRCRRSKAIGCYIEAGSSVGSIHCIEDAHGASVIGCTIRGTAETNGDGIDVGDGVTGVVVSGNVIDDCADVGIAIYDSSDGCVITNNTVKNCTNSGIWVDNCDRLVISNNIVHDNGDYGIEFSASNCQNETIIGNNLNNNTSGAMLNNAQTGNTEFGNTGVGNLLQNSTTFKDAINLSFGTSTGTKIGTGTTQKIGFFNATPVGQRTGIADVNNSTVDNTYGQQENDVITSLRTKVNAILQVLEDMGITAVA